MSVDAVRRLETQALRDRKISEEEAQQLVTATYDWNAVSREEKAELKAILTRDAAALSPAAKQTIEVFLDAREGTAPVISSRVGPYASTFADDAVSLGRDGTLHGEAGVTGYSRGYDATQMGPLRSRHGSDAPASVMLSRAENDRVRTASPGAALDAAAKAFGARGTGFEQMASAKQFFDPSAEFWWGKCHAWAWSALDDRISTQVDVDGPEGMKGVWIGGQWLSRADLGNWMMATADEISLKNGDQLIKAQLTATDLLNGTTQFLMNGGGGVVADIHNDKKKGKAEVWNQPFVASDVTTRTLDGEPALGVLKRAKQGVAVKQVTIVGTYGVERGDTWEGPASRASKTWNMYAVTNGAGRVVAAYMADDPALKGVAGLPTRKTDDLPDYLWKPKLQAIDDVLAGRPNAAVAGDRRGREFTFFVGTVLTKGVPGTVRAAFEAEVRAGATDQAALAAKYPGVANAYAPDQWARFGFDARAFGAAWR